MIFKDSVGSIIAGMVKVNIHVCTYVNYVCMCIQVYISYVCMMYATLHNICKPYPNSQVMSQNTNGYATYIVGDSNNFTVILDGEPSQCSKQQKVL